MVEAQSLTAVRLVRRRGVCASSSVLRCLTAGRRRGLQLEQFASSKSVGASFGLTPRRYQSGETERVGAISLVALATPRCGSRRSKPPMLC